MELIRGLHNIKQHHRNCAITIGNFDGLHLGHHELLTALKTKSRDLHKRTMVITFEPQPNEYFAQGDAPARLMRFREKVESFEQHAIDFVLCLSFNDALAKQSAENFITMLVAKLAPSYFLVGDDFRFGYRRAGDIILLQKMGLEFNFAADCLPTFIKAGERVSSSRIRQLLAQGDLEQVQELLGRPFSLKGRVAQGDKRGRLLGFPTANIHLHRKKVPISGVFAVELLGANEGAVKGVANVGIRPTVSGQTKVLLEVHLFDFDREIYGNRVEVKFLRKLREEQKFASLEELQGQIRRDVIHAKKVLDNLE